MPLAAHPPSAHLDLLRTTPSCRRHPSSCCFRPSACQPSLVFAAVTESVPACTAFWLPVNHRLLTLNLSLTIRTSPPGPGAAVEQPPSNHRPVCAGHKLKLGPLPPAKPPQSWSQHCCYYYKIALLSCSVPGLAADYPVAASPPRHIDTRLHGLFIGKFSRN